jgi:hypothetical protein
VSTHIPADLRRQVRALFSGYCAYCRTAEGLTAATFEVEHVIPRSTGGETILTNLCLACPTCNRCKADRIVAFDPETKAEAPLFRPQQDAWSAHFAWNDDATEIMALTPTGGATIVALRMNRPSLVRLRRMWVMMGEHPAQVE